jgi:hypothetical protein
MYLRQRVRGDPTRDWFRFGDAGRAHDSGSQLPQGWLQRRRWWWVTDLARGRRAGSSAMISIQGNVCYETDAPPCRLPNDDGLRASTKFFIDVSNKAALGSGAWEGTIWMDDFRIE